MFNMMNVFAIVIFIKLAFIGMVIAQSLIHNLIQSLQYETAMLRCLGWKHTYVSLAIILRQLVFISLPGMLAAVVISSQIYTAVNYMILLKTNNSLDIQLSSFQIGVALTISFILPLISLIQPVYSAAQVQLRDALDVNSRQIDLVQVKFHSLYRKYDFKLSELVVGLYLVSYGYVSYIQIPLCI